MPLYEFECAKCKKIFELLIRSPADEKNLACPHCKNHKVTKQLSSFRMGGSGDSSAVPSSGGHGKSSCGSCGSGSCSSCG
ncbi:MAG: zinc ribbon domain-containing protein [Candidatus Brocadiia bacterium]